MKHVILFQIIFLFAINSLLSNDNLGKYNFKAKLKNNETLVIDTIIDRVLNKDVLNIEKGLLNSVIIKSFDSENINSNDLINYLNNIVKNRNIGYAGISPNNYNTLGYNGYVRSKKSNRISSFSYYINSGLDNKFSKYYHDLFKNNYARKILIDKCSEYLVSTCEKYPKDFKYNLIQELNLLLEFTNELDSLNNIDTDRLRSYWEGFIYRRNKIDEISVNEIQETIKNLITKISLVNTNDLPEALINFNINNSLTVLCKSNNLELISKNGVRIEINPKVKINSIKYLEDNSGSFYQFEGKKNGISCKYLFSDELAEIMNTEDQANSIYFISSGGEKIFDQPDLNSQISYTLIKGDEIAIISESDINHFFFKVKTKNNHFGYLQKNIFSEEVIFEYSSDAYNKKFHQYLIDNKIDRNK